MHFERTGEELNAAALAQAFVQEVVPGLPRHPLDFALGAHAALGERGFFAEPGTTAAVVSVTALARASASLGAVAASGWLFADALRRYGGPERSPLAVRASSGEVLGCVALADPRQTSDARVVRSGPGLRFEGSFHLVPNGPVARHAVVVASEGSGLVALALDETVIDAHRAPPTTGIGFKRLPRCSLALDGVLVETASLLSSGDTVRGTPGEALIAAGRLLTAALALGIAERGNERAQAAVRAGHARPPQSTEFLLADLATELEAATLSVTRAAWLRDQGAAHTLESAAAKLLATRTATRAVHGALGVVGERDSDFLRSAYLDARALEMQNGAAAEQEDTIASVMLGER